MIKGFGLAVMAAAACFLGSQAFAQSGSINKAVGGYSFEDAAKEAPTTKKDGKPLTFAIITHTAGNGFFDPVYVGAQVAANAFGINLIKLGSEAPMDDIPREIQILNQIVNDPTINGVIMTTPQVGAYNDIVKKLEERGVVVATTNSYDGTLLRSQRHQPHRAGRLGGRHRRGGDRQVSPQEQREGRLDPVPEHRVGGQHRGQQPRHGGVPGDAESPQGGQSPARLQGRRRPEQHRRRRPRHHRRAHRAAHRKPQGRRRALRAERRRDARDRRRYLAAETQRQDLLLRLRPRAEAARADQDRRVDGLAGQQPFLQGFYPVMQLYLQIDRNIAAANLDTRAQLVTKDNVEKVGKRFEN